MIKLNGFWIVDAQTPETSNFVQYRELGQAHHAKITDGKYIKIEGNRTIVGHSILVKGTASLQIQNVYMSQTMKEGTTVSQNGTLFIIRKLKSGKLHSFDMVLTKHQSEGP